MAKQRVAVTQGIAFVRFSKVVLRSSQAKVLGGQVAQEFIAKIRERELWEMEAYPRRFPA
jgi:hypothetical protein